MGGGGGGGGGGAADKEHQCLKYVSFLEHPRLM